MTTDFTARDLQGALDGDGEGYSIIKYELRDDLKDKDWVDKDGLTDSQWCAKKDENGFPVFHSVQVVSPEDDGYDEDAAEERRAEQTDEFNYEGGYVHPYGFFKMVSNGNLGDGHEAWALWEHQDSGRLFRRGGYYSSWDAGTVLDGDIVEVVPAEVKVVRYVQKDKPDAEPFDYPAVNVS